MQYTQGSLGRVFVLRMEEGDRLPDTIEKFARDQELQSALVVYLGGAADGSRLVVGPKAGQGEQIIPLLHTLAGSQEVVGIGTLFHNESRQPILHLHAACGREGQATVGCTRAGVDVWLVGEVVILEILGARAQRQRHPQSGLELLEIIGS
jgi:predicted DNA-binding protein with PD1-like motif